MAVSDAKFVPLNGTVYRVTFAMRKNDGTLISGAAGVTQQISKDAGSWVNCTNSATEIGTGVGFYYLDLTATEMSGYTIAIVIKSTTSGAVPVDIVMNPQQYPSDLGIDVEMVGGQGAAALAQRDLGVSAALVTVDSSTYTPTTIDFETNLTTNLATGFYAGRSIIFITGALAGQAARINSSVFTANSKIKLTVTTLTAAPSNGNTFRMM